MALAGVHNIDAIDLDRLDRCFQFRDGGEPAYRPGQREALVQILQAYAEGKKNVVLDAPTGCHAAGQRVIMYDGSFKFVEDVKVGDLLMGPDSTPRTVLQLCHGTSKIYSVVPVKGEPFFVNEDHVLSLVRTNDGWGKANTLDHPTIKEYLNKSNTYKHIHKLWRTGVDFPDIPEFGVSPYFVGLLLGDGYLVAQACLTNPEPEIEQEVYTQARLWNCRVRKKIGTTGCPSYFFAAESGKNQLLDFLRVSGLIHKNQISENKKVPTSLKSGSRAARLEVLAGLLDTDGSLEHNSYDYITKSFDLACDIVFISRSLGLAAYMVMSEKYCQTGNGGLYWRVYISGNTDIIPCRVARKKAGPRRQIKDVLRTGFDVRLQSSSKDYYGFILDKDHLYLLDDFTVTHNSGKSPLADTLVKYFQTGGWGTTPKNVLVDQYVKLGWRHVKGAANYDCKRHKCNCQKGSMLKNKGTDTVRQKPGCSDSCPYYIDLVEFLDKDWKDGSITNLHFFWNSRKRIAKANEASPRGLLVIDEAHLTESDLSDMITLVITQDDMRNIEFMQNLNSEDELRDWIAGFKENLDAEVDRLTPEIRAHQGGAMRGAEAVQWSKYQRLTRIKTTLTDYTDFQMRTQWIVTLEHDETGFIKKVKLEPVYGGYLVDQCLKLADRALLMSATFLDKHFTCIEMGLKEQDTEYIQLPSPFPAENNPIYYDDSLRLNKNNLEASLPELVRKIDVIIAYEQDKRGIIPTPSHKLAKEIYGLSAFKRRMTIVEDGQRQMDAIARHIATPGSILLGPGFDEGVDLKGELGEFVIHPKIPFPPMLGNRKLMIREHDNPGYSDLVTARKLIQGSGRVVRSPEDKANGYILDGALDRLLRGRAIRYFPGYYLNKLRRYQF